MENTLLFHLRRVLGLTCRRARPQPAAPPRIDTLHPAWREVGKGFDVEGNGQTPLRVEGSGFGNGALVVVAGWPVRTEGVSDRVLIAHVPDGLFTRPRVLSVWVDNRNGVRRRSAIRCLRVMSRRTVAAYRPASGRWRTLRDALNFVVWLTAGVSAGIHVPWFFLQRALSQRSKVPWAVPATMPRPQAPIPTPPLALPRKPDIICFPIIDWHYRYQRPQQILRRLAEAGHRVFYLSQRFLGAGSGAFHLNPLVPGVTEVFLRSPVAVDIYEHAIQGDVEDGLYAALLELRAAVGLAEAICVVHLPAWTPLVLRLKADLGYRIVFDCLDELSGFRNVGARIRDLERTLAAAADRVTVTSRRLAEKHAAHDPLLVPNAADYDHFSAAKVPARPSVARRTQSVARRLGLTAPVLGYYGAISYWFDFDLIARAAAARPRSEFVLIGRVDVELPAELGALPNVHLLGEAPYEELPGYLATFDVCLIPFLIDELVEATNPVKFFEYLSAGKPVVAARMPELRPFAGECYLYDGLEEFLERVERAVVEGDDPIRGEARRAIARANTWELRVDTFRSALAGLYPCAGTGHVFGSATERLSPPSEAEHAQEKAREDDLAAQGQARDRRNHGPQRVRRVELAE